MQKLLTTLVIIFVSTSSYAEINSGEPKSESSEDGTYFKQLPVVEKTEKNSLVLESEANKLELWKILDTNKDDLLSITEASKSQVIYDQWSELDINKDNKLDFIEFSQKTEQEN
jgi:hypothetical protein